MTIATEWIVEAKHGDGAWTPIWQAVCDEIVMRPGATPSTAVLRINGARWQDKGGLHLWDAVRVGSTEADPNDRTWLFYGILTARMPVWAGDGGQGGAFEESRWLAQCPKYVLNKGATIYGQYCYAKSAYSTNWSSDWTSGPPQPNDTSKVLLATGHRCVFNPNGVGNMSQSGYTAGGGGFTCRLFDELDPADWTAEQIIYYLLALYTNTTSQALWVPSDSTAPGTLLESDWDTVLHDVTIEGLTLCEALEYVASLIGWKFRLEWYWDDANSRINTRYIFYEPGMATASLRDGTNPALAHRLYAPDDSDDLQALIDANVSTVQAGQLLQDGSNVVNVSTVLGERSVYEITAPLVPAWKDSDLAEWTVSDSDPLYINETTGSILDLLKAGTNLNSYTVYTKYHPDGSSFASYRDVGRKWALNETGKYTVTGTYNRGAPCDFSSYISSVTDADDHGYFARTIAAALTADKQGNSVRYTLDWSVDGGTTWHTFPGRVELLEKEWGVWISEPNLASILLESATDEGTNLVFSGSTDDTDGEEINYWTSLYRDKEKSRSWSSGEWKTRLRLTASIQLDTRLLSTNTLTTSGANIVQETVYDYSRRFLHRVRESNSKYHGSAHYLSTAQDDTTVLTTCQTAIDNANKHGRYSGSFELPWIFLSEGTGDYYQPRFALGDTITAIDGRGESLALGDGLHPFIDQIIYQPELCQTTINTSDARLSRTR